MLESKARSIETELNELSDALNGREASASEAPLDSDWVSRAGEIGSQMAPLSN